jgi:NADH-quinone oxidoreductase subunit H
MDFNPAMINYQAALDPTWPFGYWWAHWLVFVVVIFVFFLGLVIGFIWFERRAMARMQVRLGPNRVGPFGLLQPLADVVKVLIKEDIVPFCADKPVHFLAPIVAIAPVILLFAVIPFANGAVLADLNVGILFFISISSITGIGIFMAVPSSGLCGMWQRW